MTGSELLQAVDDLESYLTSYDHLLGRAENREHFRRFARGQLGPLERKSLEPMADAEGIEPRTLQFFFSKNEWDDVGVRDELQRKIATEHGGLYGTFVIDETSDAKKGEWTAGVGRQYCGESGKIDNCIVTVHLGYTCGEFLGLLDGMLYLPESWSRNPDDPVVTEKRRRAGIPDDVDFKTKADIALELLQVARRNHVPGRFVTGDEWYGSKPWWRKAVADLDLIYVVEVPRTVRGTMTSSLAGAMEATRSVEALANAAEGLRCRPAVRYEVHQTDKGPEVWEFKAGPFWEGKEPSGPQWLIAARNVRTDERKYFLSNAAAGTPLEVLITVAYSRWTVERCFQDCKTELGLNHAEVRKYQAIHRHLILTAVNYLFLSNWITRMRAKKNDRPQADGQPVRGRDTDPTESKNRRAANQAPAEISR